MKLNHVPKTSFDAPDTNCCPPFVAEPWDEQEFVFKDKLFVKMSVFEIMHIPIWMGSAMKHVWQQITDAGADSKDEFVMLSYDPSPWKGEHYLSVTKDVPGAEMVTLSGTFMTKVFEGPYRDVPKWEETMQDYVQGKGKTAQKIYFYFTTCPKCAKHYGRNYVVAFAQVA